ncbi:class I tRNA ligase family protein [Marinimicrobium locisalis]|uniref:class I tRNA ligase family protein n=1 Tax=Marinimicrobium locisalis TaxID=546022 RepID=UPI003222183C
MSTYIVTAAFPFIPAELCTAHMASTYLPADIYARYLRMTGEKVSYVCSTDVHGVWVKRELSKRGISHEDLIEEWDSTYKKQFEAFNIQFDYYDRTDSPRLRKLVKDSLIALKAEGKLKQNVVECFRCDSCKEYLPKRFMVTTDRISSTGKMKVGDSEEHRYACGYCGSDSISKEENQNWFVRLSSEDYTLKTFAQSQNLNSVKNYLLSTINQGVNDWDITRKNYVGIDIPFSDGDQYVYLWYESLLGYIDLAQTVAPNKGIKYRHFFGKNILYYHGIIWPYILEHASDLEPSDTQLFPRGFLNIERTDKRLIDIIQSTETYEADYLRAFFASETPDSFSDFSFRFDAFENFVNKTICNKFGFFFAHCAKLLEQHNIQSTPSDYQEFELISEFKARINKSMHGMYIRQAFKDVQEYIKKCSAYISTNKLHQSEKLEDQYVIMDIYLNGLHFLAPFMPKIINDYNIFVGLDVHSQKPLSSIANTKIDYNVKRWEKISWYE